MHPSQPYLPPRPVHPLHAIFLSFVFPLFLGAFLSDLAYAGSFQIQWSNFAQWLNAGGLLAGGFALIGALICLISRRQSDLTRLMIYAIALLLSWGIGFWNAFVHARDAWAIMPEAPWLSGIAALLALIASWFGFGGFYHPEDA